MFWETKSIAMTTHMLLSCFKKKANMHGLLLDLVTIKRFLAYQLKQV